MPHLIYSTGTVEAQGHQAEKQADKKKPRVRGDHKSKREWKREQGRHLGRQPGSGREEKEGCYACLKCRALGHMATRDAATVLSRQPEILSSPARTFAGGIMMSAGRSACKRSNLGTQIDGLRGIFFGLWKCLWLQKVFPRVT